MRVQESRLLGCAGLADGAIWCWGSNPRGQLGDGTTDPHPAPVEVVRGEM